jgi:hypothetical protein
MELNYGSVYQLASDQTEDVYVGSTICLLSERLAKHKCSYKRYLEGKRKTYVTSYKLCQYDDVRIELLCRPKKMMTKTELERLEGFYINNTENCINKRIAGRTWKEYYAENRDKKLKYHKQWREDNKDTLKVKRDKYYKDVAGVEITCECGLTYKKKHGKRHKESQKHKDLINGVVKETKEERNAKYKARKHERINCTVCNKEIARASKARHMRLMHPDE